MNKTQTFWKILRGRLIFVAAVALATPAFMHWVLPLIYRPSSELILTEVGERQLLRLRKDFKSGDVHGLKIRIRGHLNGTAVIRMFDPQDSAKIYQEKVIGSGDVDTRLDGDWVADDCRIEYEPRSATQGGLKIEYRFSAPGKNV